MVRSRRNPSSPWNPATAVEVSPEDYEKQVVQWLRLMKGGLKNFRVRHQAKITGSSGQYAFDAIAEFEILGGASILVLVECKRHADPVKRDDLLTLEAKLHDVGAHKAILFSTAGFQRGAIEYATARGIATVTFIDGRLTYETKSAVGDYELPPWANIQRFCGWLLTSDDSSIQTSLVSDRHIDALAAWMQDFGGVAD
jgi:restriction system protein